VKITKAQVTNIICRAAKTFIQSFIAAISVDMLFGITDLDTLKRMLLSMIIGAVASGISAVWNSMQVPLTNLFYALLERIFPTSEELTAEIDKAFGGEE